VAGNIYLTHSQTDFIRSHCNRGLDAQGMSDNTASDTGAWPDEWLCWRAPLWVLERLHKKHGQSSGTFNMLLGLLAPVVFQNAYFRRHDGTAHLLRKLMTQDERRN